MDESSCIFNEFSVFVSRVSCSIDKCFLFGSVNYSNPGVYSQIIKLKSDSHLVLINLERPIHLHIFHNSKKYF